MLSDELEAIRERGATDQPAYAAIRAALARYGRDPLIDAAYTLLERRPQLSDRNFARALLRAAGETGHSGAMLTEIGLTVSGTTSAEEWSGALGRLRHLAISDALAAQHLQLVKAMAIDERGYPRALPPIRTLSNAPRVSLCAGFCTPIEAAHLVSIVMETMEPATIFDPHSGRRVAHPTRTSSHSSIGPMRESIVVGAINRRIAAFSGTDVTQGEPLAVLRYEPGQQYRLHNDAIAGEANQRVCTVLIYLSDAYRGGETEFPDLGIRVRGRQGDALLFENVEADGRPCMRARHAGLPVTEGVKWLATRWIRARPIDPWTMGQSDQHRS